MFKKIIIIIILIALSCFFIFYKNFNTKDVAPLQIEKRQQISLKTEKPASSLIKEDVKKINIHSFKEKLLSHLNKMRVSQDVRKDQDYILLDRDNNMIITQVFIDGNLLISHGDIIVGTVDNLDLQNRNRPIRVPVPRLWEQGIVPYKFSKDFKNPERVMKAILHINEFTIIKMVERKKQNDYIIFKNGKNNCYSFLGRQLGEQVVSLASGCTTGNIIHELVHALGFIHEHSREDRDEFIEIRWNDIDEKYHLQFKKIPNKYMRTKDIPFDFDSIMLYSSYYFATNKNFPSIIKMNGAEFAANRKGLSFWDIERIKRTYEKVIGTNNQKRPRL